MGFFLFHFFVYDSSQEINNNTNVQSSEPLNVIVASCIQSNSPNALFVSHKVETYNETRIGANKRIDGYYPLVTINVTRTLDIQAAVKCAAKYKIDVVAKNGGHSFEGFSSTNGILLDLDAYSDIVTYSLSSNTITVQSGMRQARLYGFIVSLFPSALFGGGTCPTVGVTGLVLCGGYGMLGRWLGLGSDQVIAFTIVDANGDERVIDKNTPDIFWALRGGCSSAFGIVSSVTLQLHEVATLTTFDMTLITSMEQFVSFSYWWQTWAPALSSNVTSVLHFKKGKIIFQFLYLGRKQSAMRETYGAIVKQLHGYVNASAIEEAYVERSTLDTVLWWSHDDSLQTLDDLLAVKTLPPLSERSRRKTKSNYCYEPVNHTALELIYNALENKIINQAEWKAYNYGTNKPFTTPTSPLLRGHIYEFHYGNSYKSDQDTKVHDEELVDEVNALGHQFAHYYYGYNAYIGYVDSDLLTPGNDYFGVENTARLSRIQENYDPTNVLQTESSVYLYGTLDS